MFVYFIQALPGTPVKIGKAQNPIARLRSVQNGNPNLLRIRAVCKGGHPAERYFQSKFETERIRGEWFNETPELVEIMDRFPSWDDVLNGASCPEIRNADDDLLLQLWKLGYSYEDIAGLLSVSRQRAHQIVSPLLPQSAKGRRRRGDHPRPEEPIEQTFNNLKNKRMVRDV